MKILFLFTLLALNYAFYAPNSKVEHLRNDNFRQKVMESDDVWFIKFYGIFFFIKLIFYC